MSKLANPIFIVGAPRSGTSILGRMLENHKDLAHIKESRILWKFGNDRKSDVLSEQDARPEVIRHIRGKIETLIENNSGTRLLDKTVNNTVRLPFLYRVFPDAKVVHIIRNGYDSCLSIKDHWQRAMTKGVTNRKRKGSKGTVLQQRLKEIHWRQTPFYVKELIARSLYSKKMGKPNFLYGVRVPGLQEVLDQQEVLDACGLMWRNSVELACHFGRKMPNSQYKEIYFENLGEELLIELADFLELPKQNDFLKYYCDNFDSSRVTLHRSLASIEELETLDKWIRPTMQWIENSKN